MHESLFHSELIKFLHEDVERRCAEEGFQPDADPQLQALLQGLSPTSSDEPLPLDEIIDNYQHLFGTRGPIHIEKILMEALPAADFMALGLSRYYPRMYRGLPRLYHKSHPSQSHIKKNFTHLPSLKRQAVSKALFSLYAKLPARGKVTLFTWVIGDGLGDYVAAIEVLRLLRGRLPDLEISFVALVQEKALSSLSYPEGAFLIPYERECPLSLLTPEAWQKLRSSDLILQLPTFYPHTGSLLETLQSMPADHPVPKIEILGEYGFLESSWFHPKSGNASLGLHFLEKGILVRKPCQASWDDVQNGRLLQWRSPEHHFYLAYLTTPLGGAIYLHALLKSLEADEKGIDICIPDLGWFVQFVERQNRSGRPLLEWEMGVQAIEVYFEERVHTLSIAPTGKKVRLLCPGSLTQSDFRSLLALSGDWVAVRGNQSFSEVISQNKPFFYDGREHARYFMKDLIALAENRIGTYPSALTCFRGMQQGFLYNIPLQEGEWLDETFFQEREEWTAIALKLGLSLQDPQVGVGYRKLNQILAEEFSANAFLCHLVQRALCHRRDPMIEKLEKEEMDLFTAQAQTFAQLIRNVQHGLI